VRHNYPLVFGDRPRPPLFLYFCHLVIQVLMQPRPKELRELCELLLSCEDDAMAAQIAQQLRSAIHQYVEAVRVTMPSEATTPNEILQGEKKNTKDVA
jgi:hypothetical protein